MQVFLKLVQVQLVPEQVAYIEARRPVKGWRGLYRSVGGLDDRVTKPLDNAPSRATGMFDQGQDDERLVLGP